MAHEAALMMVNSMQRQLADLARSIVNAMKDDRVSVFEGVQLGMKGMTTATSIVALMQSTSPEERRAVLEVLEHGAWTMPQGPDALIGGAAEDPPMA